MFDYFPIVFNLGKFILIIPIKILNEWFAASYPFSHKGLIGGGAGMRMIVYISLISQYSISHVHSFPMFQSLGPSGKALQLLMASDYGVRSQRVILSR